MDPLIADAARSLAVGDPLGALNRVALRDDAPALALRGIAMAQLGDLARARVLLRDAARAFGPKHAVAHARCVVAQAEIALASRDLGWSTSALDAARSTLEAQGDRLNAAHARCLQARWLLLLGQPAEAERMLAGLEPRRLPPALRAVYEVVAAGIAIRRVRAKTAREALAAAARAASEAGIAALQAEVASASRALDEPAARLIIGGGARPLLLDEVESVLASDALIVDARRYVVRGPRAEVALASRPILFVLAGALAQAWPADAPRGTLIAQAFRARSPDESHRARLRVEIGRLRAMLGPLAQVHATARGYVLAPSEGREVLVLARPVEERHAAVLALLADGEAWSSSALALALGASQRSVQRALDALALAGKAQSFGQGRARRWMMPPVPGLTTSLLLPMPPSGN
jgi:hypothetical protein